MVKFKLRKEIKYRADTRQETEDSRYSGLLSNVYSPKSHTRNNSTENFFYFLNGHGDVTYFADSNFTPEKVETYEYTPWGVLFTFASKNKLLYTAREFDFETGLQFNRFRYYHPNLGRFMQKDLIFIENEFIYAINSPQNFADPYGLLWDLIKRQASKLIAGILELLLCPKEPYYCASNYFYCIDECVKCCLKNFPTNSAVQDTVCRIKQWTCIAYCDEVTAGKCESPS